MNANWLENLRQAEIDISEAQLIHVANLIDELHEVTKDIKKTKGKERQIKSDTDRKNNMKTWIERNPEYIFSYKFGVVKIEIRKRRESYVVETQGYKSAKTPVETLGGYETQEDTLERSIERFRGIIEDFQKVAGEKYYYVY